MVAIAVLVTSCFLRGGNRFFLVSRVQYDLRVNFAVPGVGKDVGTFSYVKGRARRLVPVIRVEGRVDIVSSNGQLVIEVFRREEEASDGEQFRRVGRDGRILCRSIQRFYFRRVSRCHVVVHVQGHGLVRVIGIRGFVRCIHAGRRYLEGNGANVLGLFGFKVAFRRVVCGDRATSLSSRQAIASANGIKVAIRAIAFGSNGRSLVLRFAMFRGHFGSGPTVHVRILGTTPHGEFRGLYRQRRNT